MSHTNRRTTLRRRLSNLISQTIPTGWSSAGALANGKLRGKLLAAGCVGLLSGVNLYQAHAANLYSENFDSLTLGPFVSGTESGGNGTDWTDTLPAGWTRDNTTTPDFTLPEFFGFTFMRKESWIATEGNQARDQFALGSGAVMVADPDAYDDSPNGTIEPGEFNVFITTAPIDLSNVAANSIDFKFDSSWRPYDGMTALVDVSFDGGANFSNILTYNTANTPGGSSSLVRVNESVSLAVNNPNSGSMVFRFGMTNAGNDWWWAVDNLLVEGDIAGVANVKWSGSVNANWDINTTQNWRTIPNNFATTYVDNAEVTFDDTATGNFNVNIPTNVQPAVVRVDNTANDYTFSGPGAITGASGLIKNGTGALTILNNNTFTGATNINAGTVNIGNGGTTGTLAGAIVNNGTLNLNRSDNFALTGAISGTGNLVKLGTNTVTLSGAANYSGTTTLNGGVLELSSGLLNGVISGPGAITKISGGTLTLGGANGGYSTGITHSGGTIAIGSPDSLGTGTLTFTGLHRLHALVPDGQTWTVANNMVFPATGANSVFIRTGDGSPTLGTTLVLSGQISGGAAGQNYRLADSDQGGNHNFSVVLTNPANNFSGTIQLWRGTLGIVNDAALGNADLIEMDLGNFNGGLRFDVDNVTLNATRAINLVGNEKIDSRGFTGTVAGNISGATLRKIGTGTLVLSGTNTYLDTQVVAGTLQIGAGGTTGTLGSNAVDISSGATVAFNRSDASTVNNPISGAGGIVQIGSGTTSLNGVSTFLGNTTVNNGTLELAFGASLDTPAVIVNNGGTFKINDGATLTNTTLPITVNSGGRFDTTGTAAGYTIDTGRTLTVGRTGAPATDVLGLVTINGNLNLGGSGNYRTATFANNLTLNGASVAMDLNNVTTTGGGVNDLGVINGNLTLSGTNTINATLNGGLASGSYTLFTYGGTLTGDASNLSLNTSGQTRQTLAFDTVSTPGSVKLNVSGSAANQTWVGNAANNAWDVNSTPNWSGVDNVFFNLDNVNFTDAGVGGAVPVTLTTAITPGVMTFNHNQNYTISGGGSLNGTGSLTKSGTGTLTLGVAGNYTGTTTINAGTLRIGDGVTDGSITGPVVNNSSFVINNAGPTTVNSVISGTGSVAITNTGTVTLNNANTYSGKTTVSGGGTLVLSSEAPLGTAPGALVADQLTLNNGNLQLDTAFNFNTNRGISLTGSNTINAAANNLTLANPLSGAGGLVINTTGTVFLNNPTNSHAGGTTLNEGTLELLLDAPGATPLGTGPLVLTGTGKINFRVTNGEVRTVANDITLPGIGDTQQFVIRTATGGAPSILQTGVRLTGVLSGGTAGQLYNLLDTNAGGNHNNVVILDNPNNSLSGDILMNRGTLAITSNAALGNVGTIFHDTWNGNGAFRFDAPNITIPTTRSFILAPTAGGSVAIPFNTNGNNATIDALITSNNTAGNFIKQGAGTLTLTNANTYQGITTISEGTLSVTNTTGSGTGTGAVGVNPTGTLAGTGIISGLVTSGGNIAPGTTGAGTLTLDGGLSLLNSTLSFELGSSSDLLQLNSGVLNAAGISTFNFSNLPGFGLGTYPLIDYGSFVGGLGNFALSSPSLGGFALSLADDAANSRIVVNVTPGTAEWVGAGGANWSSASSWSTGFTPVVEARFLGMGGSPANLDSSRSLNTLTFNSSVSYTISGPSANVLSLTGPAPVISTAGTGTQTLSSSLNLGNNTAINVNGTGLNFSLPTGTTSTVGTNVTATLAAGSTLTLGGNVSALGSSSGNKAKIVTSSGTSTLSVVNGNQVVGRVTGTGAGFGTAVGNTTIASEKSLTVDGLRQSKLTLTAGSASTFTRLNVASTDGASNGLVVLNNTPAGTPALVLGNESFIDLNDNDMVVYYTDMGLDPNPLATITQYVDNYYSFGSAPGSNVPMIGSTVVDNSGGTRILIPVDNANSQFGNVGNPFYDLTLGDANLGTGFNQVIIRFTYPGDYNLDGQVDGADYVVVDSNLGTITPGLSGGWTLGDGDFDGVVTPADYLPIDSNFNNGVGNPLSNPVVTAIPEPSTWVLGSLAAIGLGVLGLRRRAA
ncbi:MAG: autotransporter-associated beta strand repeat-containing protein [Pirellulales bacterium]|nr:autotransporter-associated beta strand repeat-containing protein [Pirellulales bacterium]